MYSNRHRRTFVCSYGKVSNLDRKIPSSAGTTAYIRTQWSALPRTGTSINMLQYTPGSYIPTLLTIHHRTFSRLKQLFNNRIQMLILHAALYTNTRSTTQFKCMENEGTLLLSRMWFDDPPCKLLGGSTGKGHRHDLLTRTTTFRILGNSRLPK